jgi:hypothetical protein
MKQENIDINIGSKLDAKGFKQAETATDKLIKSTKRLAGAVGLAFSAQAVVNFGRLAVKASLDQQAEQNRLNQLLKVGVGATAREIALLNEQAKILEKIGVVSGGNITQTQSQLATFNLQVSTIETLTPAILDYVTAEKGATATTEDFKSMTNGLAQALNGNFASLTRVGFVLDENTKKQIKSGTETQRANALVKVLNSTYKDFNANLRLTDAGQMQVLANSAQEATTIIGTGLLDALKEVGRDNSIEELAASMEGAALSAADFIRGLGQIGSFKVSGETKTLIGLLTTPFRRSLSAGPLGAITRLGEQSRLSKNMFNFPSGGGAGTFSPDRATEAAREKKRQEEEKKRAAALAKIERDRLKVEQNKLKVAKEQAALQKAGTIFDMQQTEIIAALKGDISKEERTRLELQLAILTGNSTEASKLAGQLATSQGLTKELVAFLKNLPDAKNPFSAWASYLDAIEAQVKRIAVGGTTGGGTAAVTGTSMSNGNGMFDPSDFLPQIPGGKLGAGFNQPGTVIVNVAGSVVSESELVDAVRNGLINSSLSGAGSLVARRTGTFATL